MYTFTVSLSLSSLLLFCNYGFHLSVILLSSYYLPIHLSFYSNRVEHLVPGPNPASQGFLEGLPHLFQSAMPVAHHVPAVSHALAPFSALFFPH